MKYKKYYIYLSALFQVLIVLFCFSSNLFAQTPHSKLRQLLSRTKTAIGKLDAKAVEAVKSELKLYSTNPEAMYALGLVYLLEREAAAAAKKPTAQTELQKSVADTYVGVLVIKLSVIETERAAKLKNDLNARQKADHNFYLDLARAVTVPLLSPEEIDAFNALLRRARNAIEKSDKVETARLKLEIERFSKANPESFAASYTIGLLAASDKAIDSQTKTALAANLVNLSNAKMMTQAAQMQLAAASLAESGKLYKRDADRLAEYTGDLEWKAEVSRLSPTEIAARVPVPNELEENLSKAAASGDAAQLLKAGERYASAEIFDGAEIAYKNLVEIRSNAEARYLLGNAYRRNEKYKDAIENFDEAIKLNANYTKAYIGRGRIYSALLNYGKAVVEYEKAIEIEPKNGDAYRELAYVRFKMKDFAAANETLQRAMRADETNPQPVVFFASTRAAFGKPDEARAEFEKALAMNPNNPETLVAFGEFYEDNLKNLPKAIELYEKASQLKSENDVAYSRLVSALASDGQMEKAIAAADAYLKLQPYNFKVCGLLGEIYAAAKNYDEAVKNFRQVVRLVPTFVEANLNIVRALRAQKQDLTARGKTIEAGDVQKRIEAELKIIEQKSPPDAERMRREIAGSK